MERNYGICPESGRPRNPVDDVSAWIPHGYRRKIILAGYPFPVCGDDVLMKPTLCIFSREKMPQAHESCRSEDSTAHSHKNCGHRGHHGRKKRCRVSGSVWSDLGRCLRVHCCRIENLVAFLIYVFFSESNIHVFSLVPD